jgi:hypothetical protein
MNRQIGIATRSPTTSQSASMTAIQANMLISSSQGCARTNRGGRVFLTPLPPAAGSFLVGQETNRILDFGVDQRLSIKADDPVAAVYTTRKVAIGSEGNIIG